MQAHNNRHMGRESLLTRSKGGETWHGAQRAKAIYRATSHDKFFPIETARDG